MIRHCIHAFQRRGFLLSLALALGGFLLVAALPQGVKAQAQPGSAAADSVKSNKLCPKCGVANLPEARFCFSCGAAFEAGAVPAVLPESARADSTRCPKCGTERLPQAEFCSNCGVSLATSLPSGAIRITESGPKKDPGLAFCLSLLLPGTGQLYNEQPGKTILHMGLYGYGVYLQRTTQGWEDMMRGIFGFVVCGIAMGWSATDGALSAGDINRLRGYSVLKGPGVGLVFIPDPKDPGHAKLGVGLRAGF